MGYTVLNIVVYFQGYGIFRKFNYGEIYQFFPGIWDSCHFT